MIFIIEENKQIKFISISSIVLLTCYVNNLRKSYKRKSFKVINKVILNTKEIQINLLTNS